MTRPGTAQGAADGQRTAAAELCRGESAALHTLLCRAQGRRGCRGAGEDEFPPANVGGGDQTPACSTHPAHTVLAALPGGALQRKNISVGKYLNGMMEIMYLNFFSSYSIMLNEGIR